MKLEDALKKHAPKQNPCKAYKILEEQLKDNERELFWKYRETGMSAARLADALTDSGHQVSADVIERHLNFVEGKTNTKLCCCRRIS